ncbi:Uncharacterized conserved protein, DUF2147 family [Flagellimonas taeanensis]|uniref:Uncharacterized conserved protein, DUF2147 family n=1 Tax=Flagellimonas taeanensis TaxID=1005926 RepID=A0A1M6WZW0_9FLAO|nr:DUF2147 domain-containing protein [Allomuricauda taeanensis]SFB99111.1 Uncharacterized conserved protein, DUF2147 family [Allomuricauda taeanensis]SHK99115.1 Uncharacterized conserved protein, DUF2147 family [Allomuricauda taeanensis]
MKNVLLAAILLVSLSAMAQKLEADHILGVWQSENYKIEFFKEGEIYSAKLLWSKDMFEPDGKTPKKDVHNPDENLRDRPIKGITHITGLAYGDGEYKNGKLYSVQDGNTYSFKGELQSENELESRAFKGVTLLGRTIHWTRVP